MPRVFEANLVEIDKLREKVNSVKLPQGLLEKANMMIERAQTAIKFEGYFPGMDQVNNYIDLIIRFPWFNRSQDIIEIQQASEALDKNHYGLKEIKERILEYIAVLKLSKALTEEGKNLEESMRPPILMFVGLVGTGKTTIAYSIAQSLGRKIVRVPFGGLGSAADLRGQSRAYSDAEPSLIVKAFLRAGTKNPVILLDELDRVTNEARAGIMGVLVEILDPEQNSEFNDHYMDYPVDLSEVLFVATSNKAENIAQAVLDRFEQISMPFYNDKDKTVIAKNFLLPKIIRASGLTPEQITITENTWPVIIRPAGFDAGMRTLERTITSICRKVALLTVQGQGKMFTITPENVKSFLHSDISIY